MKSPYIRKKRNAYNRKRLPFILISAEGGNKTEKYYFSSFTSRSFKIIFASGNETDPVNLVKGLIKDYNGKELDADLGDIAFCIVDGDVSKVKEQQILAADKIIEKINGRVIVSNPCFEIWFLCHFTDSAKRFSSSGAAVKRLREFIPEYEKGLKDIADLLEAKLDTAIANAKKLERYNRQANRLKHRYDNQPGTEVYQVIERILELREKRIS